MIKLFMRWVCIENKIDMNKTLSGRHSLLKAFFIEFLQNIIKHDKIGIFIRGIFCEKDYFIF